MNDRLTEYEKTDDLNRKYRLLREEMGRLRGAAQKSNTWPVFDEEAVATTLRELSDRVDGYLLAFVANDFGLPLAFRPETLTRDVQADVRRAILWEKYDSHPDLNEIRRELLDSFPGIHKAIIVEYHDDQTDNDPEEALRYHLPEGSHKTTNFLTVREMVGLVDYTTNSAQRDGLSKTY